MLRAHDKKLVKDTTSVAVAAVAVAAALGSQISTCSRWSPALVNECRTTLRRDLPGELEQFVHPFVDPLCDTLADGHWALFAIVVANALCYVPAKVNWVRWSISRDSLSHERLFKYQLAHANHAHIVGNMLTLLAVGSEVSTALGCNQLLLLALYLACGWAGGFAAALLSPASTRTVGASGAVSGVIVALSVLRPNSAVDILGDVKAAASRVEFLDARHGSRDSSTRVTGAASIEPGVDIRPPQANPLMLLLGTLLADLSRGGISWQAHFGGGAAGCLLALPFKLFAA